MSEADGDEPCRGVYDEDYEPSEEPDRPDPKCWSCMDYGYIEKFHPSTDALLGHLPCPDLNDPKRHPPCGVCEACLWTRDNGAVDEVTGQLSHPACTGPPPDVKAVASLHGPDCDGTCNYGYPNGCPPF